MQKILFAQNITKMKYISAIFGGTTITAWILSIHWSSASFYQYWL